MQLFNCFWVFRRILLCKIGMPVPGAPIRLGHCVTCTATPSTFQATLAARSRKTITPVLTGTCHKGTTTAMPAVIILRR